MGAGGLADEVLVRLGKSTTLHRNQPSYQRRKMRSHRRAPTRVDNEEERALAPLAAALEKALELLRLSREESRRGGGRRAARGADAHSGGEGEMAGQLGPQMHAGEVGGAPGRGAVEGRAEQRMEEQGGDGAGRIGRSGAGRWKWLGNEGEIASGVVWRKDK